MKREIRWSKWTRQKYYAQTKCVCCKHVYSFAECIRQVPSFLVRNFVVPVVFLFYLHAAPNKTRCTRVHIQCITSALPLWVLYGFNSFALLQLYERWWTAGYTAGYSICTNDIRLFLHFHSNRIQNGKKNCIIYRIDQCQFNVARLQMFKLSISPLKSKS